MDITHKWLQLRKDLFGSVEPTVTLLNPDEELIPGNVARISHGNEKNVTSHEEITKLNRKLIKWGHGVPLEFANFVFHIENHSKACQCQLVRHRIASYVYDSTRYIDKSQAKFVYNTYHYIDDEKTVKILYSADSDCVTQAIQRYELLRCLGARKEDARKVIPVSYATSCYMQINARSLRNLFKLRLDKKAEWEIARLATVMYDLVMMTAPSLFEDLDVNLFV